MSLGGGDGRPAKNTAGSWWSATTSFFQEFSNSLVKENQETFDNLKAKAVELGGRKGVKIALSKLTETAKLVAEKTAPFFTEDVEEQDRRAERKRQVGVVQSNESTYTTDPNQMFEKAFSKWKSSNPPEEIANVERTILDANPKVREFHEKLVPIVVSNYEFWSRYMFRIQQTENFLQDRKTTKLKTKVTEIPLEDWGSFSESEEDDKPEEGEQEDKPKLSDKELTTGRPASQEEPTSPTNPETLQKPTTAPESNIPPSQEAETHKEGKQAPLEEKKSGEPVDPNSRPDTNSIEVKTSNLASTQTEEKTASNTRPAPSDPDPKLQLKNDSLSAPRTTTDSTSITKAQPPPVSNAVTDRTQQVTEQPSQGIQRKETVSPSISDDEDDEEEEDWANWG